MNQARRSPGLGRKQGLSAAARQRRGSGHQARTDAGGRSIRRNLGKPISTTNGKTHRLGPGNLPIGRSRGSGMLLAPISIRMRTNTLMLLLALFHAPALRAQAPQLAGIAHVAFRVDDLDRSRDFYRQLGYEQAFELSEAGKVAVAFIKINDRQFIELYPRSDNSQTIGYESTDISDVHDAYAERDLHPSEIEKARAGNLLFVIHDPEGQTIEFTEYAPASLHSLDRGNHIGRQRVSGRLIGVELPVRDVAAERAFYTEKLGFLSGSPSAPTLQLSGDSSSAIELEAATATVEPEIIFGVESEERTAKALRRRRLNVQQDHDEVSFSGSDGVRVVFRQTHATKKR